MAFGFTFFKQKEIFLPTHKRRQPWICLPINPLRKVQSQPVCISGGWRFCDVAKTIGGAVNRVVNAWTSVWLKSGKTLEISLDINVLCTGGKKMEPSCLTPRRWKFISTNTWNQD
jgi:hypothetical protein